MRLSEAEVAAFYEQGFLVRERVFAEEELVPLRAAFARLYDESATLGAETQIHRDARFVFEGPHLHRVVWAGAVEPELLAVSEDPRLLEPAQQLLGSEQVVQLLNQCHFKMPGDEVAFAWHQDSQHRRYGTEDWTDVNGRGSFVQTILTVDPCPTESGPLEVYPGSCRYGHLGLRPGATTDDLPDDVGDAVTLALPPGSLMLFGPFTIHGSRPNLTDRPRRVLINGYAAVGANRFVYPGSGTGRSLPC